MKRLALISLVVITMLFSNISPVHAQVQVAIGLLQTLSLLLTSKGDNSKTDQQPTGEELVNEAVHTDIIGPKIKEDCLTRWAKNGKNLEFGEIVENRIVENSLVVWYNNAKVNGVDSVIIILCTIPDHKRNYLIKSFGTIIFERNDNGDQEKLENFIKNPEEKKSYLASKIQKYRKNLSEQGS